MNTGSGFGQQQNQQTQQNLADFNSNQATLSNNTFGNTGTSDLFGLNLMTNNSTVSSNGLNGNRNNSFGAGTNGGNFVSTTSNFPSSLNNTLSSSNNLVSKFVLNALFFRN